MPIALDNPPIFIAASISFFTSRSGAICNRATNNCLTTSPSLLFDRILAAKLLAPNNIPTIGYKNKQALNADHHFLNKLSAFGSSIAAKASGDITTHNIRIACRNPSMNTVVKATIRMNTNPAITADNAKNPIVAPKAKVAIPVAQLPLLTQLPDGASAPPLISTDDINLYADEPTTFDISINNRHRWNDTLTSIIPMINFGSMRLIP